MKLVKANGNKVSRCLYCGHRCCSRRYYEGRVRKRKYMSKKYKSRKNQKKNLVRRFKKKGRVIRNSKKGKRLVKEQISKIAELIQVGSRSPMLSPLCIDSSIVPNTDTIVEEKRPYSEMIHEALKKLTVWRQNVETTDLLEYIRNNYPVNPERRELYNELKEKLRIASLVGIVEETYEGYWSLKSPFHLRNLTINHVTLFWEAYGDTLSAIKRKKEDINNTVKTDEQTNTATNNAGGIFICDDII